MNDSTAINDMASENNQSTSSISNATTLEEMADFWDNHSTADYEGQMHDVEMVFDPARDQIG